MLRRSFVSTVVGLAFLSACGGGGDGATGPQATVVGVYQLQSINASPLPFTILQIGADRIEITGSQLSLNADNSFTEITTFRVTESGTVTTETGQTLGAYSRNGNNITFTDASDGSTYSASWDGGRQITQTAGGLTLVYRK
jgi:hypothetical protein